MQYFTTFLYRSALEGLVNASDGNCVAVVTADDWSAPPMTDLLEYLAESHIEVADRRRLFAGFLLHPAYTQPWHARLAREAEEAAAVTAEKQSGGAVVAPSASDIFSVRRHAVTDVAQAFVLKNPQAGSAASDTELVVPLGHLLRKVCRMGRTDAEIPIGCVFWVREGNACTDFYIADTQNGVRSAGHVPGAVARHDRA